MDHRLALRLAIILVWLATIASVVVSFATESLLPSLLQDYLSWDLAQRPTKTEEVALLVGMFALVMNLIGSFGLFFFKRWAVSTYITSLLASAVATPFLGPIVTHGYVALLDSIGAIASGIVIALIFFSDVIERKGDDT